jgi:hypothetical protein
MRIGLFIPCHIDAFFPMTVSLRCSYWHGWEWRSSILWTKHVVVKVDGFPWAQFPHKIGLHNTCTTLRKLRTTSASEIDEPFFSKPLDLLRKVKGIS